MSGLSEVSTARAARARRARRRGREPRVRHPRDGGGAASRRRAPGVGRRPYARLAGLAREIPRTYLADISGAVRRDAIPTEGGLLDASALAPASLDVTRESTGSGAAFDAGTTTRGPRRRSSRLRVQYDPHRGVLADTAKHGRRAGVPLPPAAAAAPTADGFRPPLSPPAATPSSARAHALASSYSAPKPPGPSMSEKRGNAAVASSSQKTPAAATSGNADAPPEARSVGLPPTPAGAFVRPAARRSRRARLGARRGLSGIAARFDGSTRTLAVCARRSRAHGERARARNEDARSSATPPAPRKRRRRRRRRRRQKRGGGGPAAAADQPTAARAPAAPSEDEDEDKDEDEEVLTAEEARSSSEDAGTVPADDLTDEHRSESISQPWQLGPCGWRARHAFDPETRRCSCRRRSPPRRADADVLRARRRGRHVRAAPPAL